ncbi:hypothetical protein K1719_022432 [Acacia pycnantha]|nr:hypothetical protein K1719_022432 [Acacia pycnantha]
MAPVTQLPCDCNGICRACKVKPAEAENLTCKTCATQWHVDCLSCRPETMAEAVEWECPDCSSLHRDLPVANEKTLPEGAGDLIAAIRAIEADGSLSDMEKAKKRQWLLSGKAVLEEGEEKRREGDGSNILDILNGTLQCSFCLELLERPVTTPCGHNFCLKCFKKWVGQGKKTCAKCRAVIPSDVASGIRINSAVVNAIRAAKASKASSTAGETWRVYQFVHNQDRPDRAYTTERAKRKGKANAASGRIFVTVPQDHFGPITAENDPLQNQGVLVGQCWADRFECRQWGAHFPHISGIAGQSKRGAQSVVLSGGYIDDEDHGEWFIYTGSGGRDLKGNKRTSKEQSFDQTFVKSNLALKVSCLKGYPVRVLRSHKDKQSPYAPREGIRYDGIYRIEKCWAKQGVQGFKVCRYLFVRCENEPAPWTSDDHGDRPRRRLPEIQELQEAVAVIEREEDPSWGYDEQNTCWRWMKPPPPSKRPVRRMDSEEIEKSRKIIRKSKNISISESLLRGLKCLICGQVMASPVTTPCGHNFCKTCLEGTFAGVPFLRERTRGGRSLRSQKNVRICPACPTNISDFLQNVQINRELMTLINSLKEEAEQKRNSEDLTSENSSGDKVEEVETVVEKDGEDTDSDEEE